MAFIAVASVALSVNYNPSYNFMAELNTMLTGRCAKYLDKKIDVERFEKMYKQEIYKLVNDPQQKEFYATNQTTYASTVAVYKNWFSQS